VKTETNRLTDPAKLTGSPGIVHFGAHRLKEVMHRIAFHRDLYASSLTRVDANQLDIEVYRQLGVFVLRSALPEHVVAEWTRHWMDFQEERLSDSRHLDPYNPVVLNEALPDQLANLYRHPTLLDLVETIYPDLGFFLQRFLLKDRHNVDAVFLHQDFAYNVGWPDKTSVFVPLTPMSPENGGLVLYPGTHHLGYLGDAGELDPALLDPGWPRLAPTCQPGDVLLMHDCTWHESGPRVTQRDRILVQITYQPSSDPSSTECLRGVQHPRLDLSQIPAARLFRRSRSSRLRELQQAIDAAATGEKTAPQVNSPSR
jgi:hypothetical protein